jgi:hypothetical protein
VYVCIWAAPSDLLDAAISSRPSTGNEKDETPFAPVYKDKITLDLSSPSLCGERLPLVKRLTQFQGRLQSFLQKRKEYSKLIEKKKNDYFFGFLERLASACRDSSRPGGPFSTCFAASEHETGKKIANLSWLAMANSSCFGCIWLVSANGTCHLWGW